MYRFDLLDRPGFDKELFIVQLYSALLLASSLFIVRSSFEMFILTPRDGPQMLFFRVMHTWPLPAILLCFASAFAYQALVWLAVLAAAARLSILSSRVSAWVTAATAGEAVRARRLARFIAWCARPGGRGWLVAAYGVAALLTAHCVALVTYDQWSMLFWSRLTGVKVSLRLSLR